jgi:hypothetical protein
MNDFSEATRGRKKRKMKKTERVGRRERGKDIKGQKNQQQWSKRGRMTTAVAFKGPSSSWLAAAAATPKRERKREERESLAG